jgi:hypothetical protein
MNGYKKNKMSTDRESGKGNKRARVTRGSRKKKKILQEKAVEATKQEKERKEGKT